MTRARGIDIWAGQGLITPAEWAALKAQGLSYVFVKCLDGLTLDPMFRANAQSAKDAGLYVGAYFVVYPWARAAPEEYADHAALACGLLGAEPGTLPPMLDLEEPQPPTAENLHAHGLTPAAIDSWGCEWGLQASKRWAVRPLLYTYPDYYHAAQMAQAPRLAEAFDFMPAEYDHPDRWPLETEHPRSYEPWASAPVGRAWTFWQWAGGSGLTLPNGRKVDTSIFFGDEDKLREYASSVLV